MILITPRYKPDEFCVNDPELVIMAVKHYIDALKMNAKARNMGAIWGGRTPHYQNIVVGGVTSYPDVNQVARFRTMLDEQAKFINEVYIPHVLLFGTGPLSKLAEMGVGGGHYNYLSYGAFEKDPNGKELVFPAGVIVGMNPADIKIDKFDPDKITESVKYGWYKNNKAVHPYNGEQVFDLDKDKKDAYSFVKAPRYNGKPMEVGPLARMLVAKNPDIIGLVKKGAKPGAVARHVAPAIETKLVSWCLLSLVRSITYRNDKTWIQNS